MKLYEINSAIEEILSQLVDPETGEIVDDSDELMYQLDALEMDRTELLQYLAKEELNLRSEQEQLKAEEQRLKERRERLAKQEARLMAVLERECGGQKTDLGVATVSYRKSESVNVSDYSAAMHWLLAHDRDDCLRYKDPEINKADIKKLIKSGTDVPGIELVKGMSCSLK